MKKILLAILVFLAVILFNISFNSCFATFDFTYDGEEYKLADLPLKSTSDEIVIIKHGNWYRFLAFNSNHNFYIQEDGKLFVEYLKGSNFYTAVIQNITVSNKWINFVDYTDYEGVGLAVFLTSEVIVYNTVDIYDYQGKLLYPSSGFIMDRFEITLSNSNKTNPPIEAYSNYFPLDDFEKYECYISEDGTNWEFMYYQTLNDTINHTTKFRFWYKITKNGAYYFKLVNKETGEEKYHTYNITNILNNSSNTFNDLGIPMPFCTYERVGEQFIIKTQTFDEKDILKYKCMYISENDYKGRENYDQWEQMGIGSKHNTKLNKDEYYFFFTVPASSTGKCAYFMVFYDYHQKEYGDPSAFNAFFDEMNEYSDKVARCTKRERKKA